jgi:hypothetical protein
MTEYRASFDAAIRFSNGGDLTAHGFRVDLPSRELDEAEVAALFVASTTGGAPGPSRAAAGAGLRFAGRTGSVVG